MPSDHPAPASPIATEAKPSAAESLYRQRIDRLTAERDSLRQIDRRMNAVRAATFLVAAALLGIGYGIAPWPAPWLVAGWLGVLGFLIAITYHEAARRRADDAGRRLGINRRLQARLDRRWDALPRAAVQAEGGLKISDQGQQLADDLDLLGRGSLWQLVSLATTTPGQRTLARWITEPPESVAEVVARREAAEALAADSLSREDFYFHAATVAESTAAPDAFVRWASGPRWLGQRPWLVWLSRLLPLGWPLLILVAALGWADVNVVAAAAIGLFAITGLISAIWVGQIHDRFLAAAGRGGEVASYRRLFEALRQWPEGPSILADAHRATDDPEQGALPGLEALGRLRGPITLRHNPLAFLPLYLPLQLLFLWDFHVMHWLERWQQRFGSAVPGWFEALGQAEAAASVAALIHDYPQWARPSWSTGQAEQVWRGTDVGHPLLGDAARVTNDVTLGPAGRLLLVTGSNMSGKSTLLRSVGLNTVLAWIGGPVCATSLELPLVRLATSMRVRDSLQDGVSFFMAELRRLREVVDAAAEESQRSDRVLLCLLDEILQGTNNRERHIAVSQVLKRLCRLGALGAVSTHDLDLASDPSMADIATVVHFRETLRTGENGTESMTFDYRMHPGVTPTTNALRLLEMVGLDLDEP